MAALHRLPIQLGMGKRCALRCAPMAARSLRHLIGDATLAQSHLCAHTWPGQRAVTLDVHVCNFGADHSGKAQPLREALPALSGPTTVLRHALQRGALP
ncbi:S-adenosylmethionine decarboxylase [Verminephrobacter eiseniae]|uniref:S-adenosylmethionine decarboxylase n=1 Tax=Verminephrobacter eiseniae TaxID=364317 RepID=UPI002244867E|nr:S-adenosylmethionine decarboxylase [Verminephrobacter eiseniae]